MTDEIKRLQWIVYKGVTVAHTDFRGLQGKALSDQMEFNLVELLEKASGVKKSLLLLTDLTDVPMTGDTYSKVRKTSEVLAPYLKARATLGVSGSRKFVVNALNAIVDYPLKVFSTKEAALEWLVEQSVIR